MKAPSNRSPSFGYLVAGGLATWYFAGFFSTILSLDTPSKLASLSFPMKVGGVWAAVGLLFVVPLPTWFNMSLERSLAMRGAGVTRANPMGTALISTAFRALLLGAGAGFALGRWAMPKLGLPDGLVLADSAGTCGAVLTAIAYLISVPIAAGVASRLR